MAYRQTNSRTILQRRSSLSNLVQQLLDGGAVIGITWGLVTYYTGGFYSAYVNMMFLMLGIMALTYDRFAIYRSNATYIDKAFNLLKAWSLTFLVLVVLAFLTKQSDIYSRSLIAKIFVSGYFAQLTLHYIFRIIYQKVILHSQQSEKVLIVGQSKLAYYLQHKISSNPWIGEQVIGFIRLPGDEKQTSGRKAPGRKADPMILGNIEHLSALIDQYDISMIYVVTPLQSSKALEDIYTNTLDKHVAIHWIPDIFSLRLVNHSVKEISGIPVITLSETPLIGMRMLLKSLEDKLLSALILIAILPILLIVAIAVKLDSPGPVFFRQNRAGWSGKSFKIWKFRSMYVHQEEAGKLKQAQKNDSRITRVGAFIRKTSLDELPQIFNVLTGDMSLVGPRPHALQHDKEYSQRIFDYFARHHIKPGITGLAQVRGLRGETTEIGQMVQRVEADIEYINNWSIWLDITILFRTVFAFTGKGAY
ncbi:MAG: undecaprenyl-phosphate glucose phosphotransferase [Methylotenera sp.]|uniref:undecaprenyl-phosphate glucose phosphotransferase n=3 Tax=Methylotenera sp. TaxID=2051956 RepID=UPI0027313907|nr:undecaprenyl-phosphate glucose phosphotransferase [Methylotenera sp.]MDP1523601.1 undecaprenyl-phosphate glucose phosphotransferase [Methylotenera sp.]